MGSLKLTDLRERMGSGGLRGLQILRSGAIRVRGGFDSHAFPPTLPGRGIAAIPSLVALAISLSAAAPAAAALVSTSRIAPPSFTSAATDSTPPEEGGVIEIGPTGVL